MWRCVLLMFVCGCGTGGDAGSGNGGLPNPGYAPYEFLANEEGVLTSLFPENTDLTAPFARIEAGRVALYLTQCTNAEPCQIVRAESDDGEHFGPLTTVATYEDGLRDPVVARAPEGDELWVVNDMGTALIRLTAGQNGKFSDPVPMISAKTGVKYASPSIVFIGNHRHVFWTATEGESSTMMHALDPASASPNPENFNAVGTDLCSETPCWAQGPIIDSEVRYVTSATGRKKFRAIVSALSSDGVHALGYIVSTDAQHWSNYAFNPALATDADLKQASQARLGHRYLVYAVAGRRTLKIVVAVNEEGQPSNNW